MSVSACSPILTFRASLQIATLVPESTEPPTQQFRIMQRDTLSVADDDGASRGTSVSADDGNDSSGTRKTFEERAVEYAAARKRIIGNNDIEDDSISASASQPRSRQASRYGDDDDIDVPRRAFVADSEIVYGSLSHPTAERPSAPLSGPGPQGVPPNFNHAHTEGYPGGAHVDGYLGMQQPFVAYPNPPLMGHDPSRQMGPYPNQQFSGPMPMGGYGPPWQPPLMPGQLINGSPMQQQHFQAAMAAGGQGWYPPDMSAPQQQAHNMMPRIPQGLPMACAPSFPYGPQQQAQQGRPYGFMLAQPTPMRPGLDPLSSTASSISSRSYQDVHSRPHSRGSTTSTRSAASSARLGAMYPSGQQSYGYRQKAVKPSQGSFSSSIGRPTFDTKRSGRQSPVSPASTSSCDPADPRPRPLRRAHHVAHPRYTSSSPSRVSTHCRRGRTGRLTMSLTTHRPCLYPVGASRARVTSRPFSAALQPQWLNPCRSRRSRCGRLLARPGMEVGAEVPSAKTPTTVRQPTASSPRASTPTSSLPSITATRART